MGNEYSQELIDLAFAALDHGIDSVREGGPLIPFVMRESGGDRSLERLASELLEDAVAQAIAHVQASRNQPGTRHALAYDGYLTLPTGERFDAIYAEGVEAGTEAVMTLAQRYRPKRSLRKFETIGNPALLPAASGKLAPSRRSVSDEFWILTGAPGSGKTTILDELRESLRCVDEPARRVLAEQREIGGSGIPKRDPRRFVELLLEVAIADHVRALGAGPTLFDRGIPDCIAYAIHLGVDPGPSVRAADRYRYHVEVLILEPWEEIYVTDDERTMSLADTVAFHAVLEDAFDRSGYRRITVPRGPVTERAAFVSEWTLGRRAGSQ